MDKSVGKYKYLAVNTILFTVSSLLSKFISFLMIPFYTGILSTEEYGIADLITTTVTLLIPLLTLSIIEAAIRFCLTNEGDKKEIFTTTSLMIIIASFLCFLIEPIVSFFSKTLEQYFIYFFFIFVFTITEQLFFKFAKGIENVRVCAINAIVVVVSTVIFNIIFLIAFRKGLEGYLIAIVLSKMISAIYLFISVRMWNFFSIHSVKRELLKDMLKYSIPFIPTASAWWINTASDRYIIIAICGVAANGLYSAGSKIPSLLSIFTSIFQQAWQISGVKEYKDKEYPTFFSNIYCSYIAIIGLGCSILINLSPILAMFLFKNDFYSAWKYTPFLLIGTVFSGMSGVLASLFNAVKKNGQLAISTISGAVINLVMNIIFVRIVGPIGAAIATAVSFGIVWIVRYYTAQRICQFKGYMVKNSVFFTLLFIQATCMSFEIKGMYIWTAIIFVLNCCIYRKELYKFLFELPRKLLFNKLK